VLTTEFADARILDHNEPIASPVLVALLAPRAVVAATEELEVRQEQALEYLAAAEHGEAYDGIPVAFLQSDVAVSPLFWRALRQLSTLQAALPKILLRFELPADTVVVTINPEARR
jgi:hypothetical protein